MNARGGLAVPVLLALSLLAAATDAHAQPRPKPAKPAPAAPAPSNAPPQDLVERGRALFEDQHYEESIQVLSAALLRPSNTKEQRVEIHRLLALDYITLGRKDEAESAVRGLLVIDPDYQLPASESPRFRDFFAQARARWEADGRPGLVAEAPPPPKPVVLRHASPSESRPDKAIELRGRFDDLDARVKAVRVFYRTGSKGEFTEAEVELSGPATYERGEGGFRARIPATAVKPPLVEYYVVVEGEAGAPLVARGEPSAPLRVAVNEPTKGWVLPVAIGGGVLGAAALVGVLALAGVFKSSAPPGGSPGTSIVSVSVSEASR